MQKRDTKGQLKSGCTSTTRIATRESVEKTVAEDTIESVKRLLTDTSRLRVGKTCAAIPWEQVVREKKGKNWGSTLAK